MNLPRSTYYHQAKSKAVDDSELGYRPPVKFEELFVENQKTCPTALTQSV